MPRREFTYSGYRELWLFAMFDLPVKTKREKLAYVRFRNLLLEEGFCKMQFSIYARFCGSEDIAETHRDHLRRRLPSDGHIRLLTITDRQFGKMEVYFGKKRHDPEATPQQLALF